MTDTITETPAPTSPPWSGIPHIYDVTAEVVEVRGFGHNHCYIDLVAGAIFPPEGDGVAAQLEAIAALGRHITRLAEAHLAQIGAEACTTTLDPDGKYRHHQPCPTHPDATVVTEEQAVSA